MNSPWRALQRCSSRLVFLSAMAGLVLAAEGNASAAPAVGSAAGGVRAALALRTRSHPGHLAIESFTAKPATLPAKGGRVRLSAIVANARSCRITADTTRAFSASVDCASGRTSIAVNVAKNTRTATRTYRFVLRADDEHGASVSAAVTVRERGRAAPGAGGSIAITLEPSSEAVAAGTTASFTATASGYPASVQWQVSTDGGAVWVTVAGATASRYSFTAAAADSGNEYRAAFSSGTRTATSSAATLTVTAASPQQSTPPSTSPPPPPAIPQVTEQPADVDVAAGASASFMVGGSGLPAPAVQWQVSTDSGVTWADIAGASNTTYTFTTAGADNGNEYRAVLTNSAGSATSAAATLTITTPQVTLQPLNQNVLAGTTASFTAAASGLPTPTVQWQVSTDAGATWSDASGATATSPTYQLVTSSADNANEYRAEFASSAGTATTDAATLAVDTIPQVTEQPADVDVAAGASASFMVGGSGLPAPAVQWQVSTDSGVTWADIAGASNTTYTFTTAGADNGNEYRAVLTNSAGSATSAAATLTITTPQVTLQPQNQNVVAGTTASFTAAASGLPTPTVQWQVSTDAGATWSDASGATATSPTYQLVTSSADNANEYRAEFASSAGTATTDAATLAVGQSQSSTNWSGYVDTGMTFSAVSASWVVPLVHCTVTPNGRLAVWVGIDGEGGNTVEQDGTEADCSGGSANYFAWYEMFGDQNVNGGDQQPLPSTTYPLSAGDQMSASVSVAADSTWTLHIADVTKDWTFNEQIPQPTPPSPTPAQASAEWIVERPNNCGAMDCSPAALADFGTVTFTLATATGDGTTGPISAFPFTFTQMTSSSSSALLAVPDPLDPSGTAFTDNWYASS